MANNWGSISYAADIAAYQQYANGYLQQQAAGNYGVYGGLTTATGTAGGTYIYSQLSNGNYGWESADKALVAQQAAALAKYKEQQARYDDLLAKHGVPPGKSEPALDTNLAWLDRRVNEMRVAL